MAPSLREVTRSTLEAYVDAWRAGKTEDVLAAFADDVVFHYFGTSDIAGTHVGKDASVAAMRKTMLRASRELVEVLDVLVGDALGSLVAVERFARPDAGIESVDLRRVFLYRVAPDGRIVEVWILDENQALMDRLWA